VYYPFRFNFELKIEEINIKKQNSSNNFNNKGTFAEFVAFIAE
jgi:hypothetical protein